MCSVGLNAYQVVVSQRNHQGTGWLIFASKVETQNAEQELHCFDGKNSADCRLEGRRRDGGVSVDMSGWAAAPLFPLNLNKGTGGGGQAHRSVFEGPDLQNHARQ